MGGLHQPQLAVKGNGAGAVAGRSCLEVPLELAQLREEEGISNQPFGMRKVGN